MLRILEYLQEMHFKNRSMRYRLNKIRKGVQFQECR